MYVCYINIGLIPLRRYGDTGKALINKWYTLYIIYVYAEFVMTIRASCQVRDAFLRRALWISLRLRLWMRRR